MTNKEKYEDMLIELAVNRRVYTLKNGVPVSCSSTPCGECDFCDKSSGECTENGYAFREWLDSEYKEPPVDWSKVAVDTPILVRGLGWRECAKRYFAKYENGLVYAWVNGRTSWSAGGKDYATNWKYAKLAESEELK